MQIVGGFYPYAPTYAACSFKVVYCFNSFVAIHLWPIGFISILAIVAWLFCLLISIILFFIFIEGADQESLGGLTDNTMQENNDSEEEDSEDCETDEEHGLSANGQSFVDASSSTR